MSPNKSKTPPDPVEFLNVALSLAGQGRTEPNPMVGAVVVKDGRIVGRGYHRAAGMPHAEVQALLDAGPQSKDADLYVTLEPCNHYGRTPPCTEAILRAGIRRVWYGMDDPNPDVLGGGAQALRRAGIEVHGPLMDEPCRRLNEVYLLNISLRRPFVYLKLAMSLDGRIATRTGHSQWITSEQSRNQVHRLRDRVSAIMTGIGTVLADNPSLTTRLPEGRGHDPLRVVVDSSLRIPTDSKVFNPSSSAGVVIAAGADAPSARADELSRAGAVILRTSAAGKVELRELLDQLFQRGVCSILLEGGAGLAWGALDEGIVDRCMFYYAPMIIGGAHARSGVSGEGIDRLEEAPRLKDVEIGRVGPDVLITGRTCYTGPDLTNGARRREWTDRHDSSGK
ncbi:MAG: bifunctional diaminohydroxyphosphoribosylaminopyrimidine deaminase/5-amino-6-(5-phosphoribosylamino)uracil reductase RibD [Thermodesulfobacteriota bacterium]